MDWCRELTLVILLIAFQGAASSDYEDEDDSTFWSRCPSSIRNKLKNGRVKIRSRGRIAKFFCNPGFELVGKRFATCVRNQWNNPLPECVARGCPKMSEPANGRVTEMYRGAMLTFDCLPGYAMTGPNTLYCDGRRWSDPTPSCTVSSSNPRMSCDFEEPELCGWSPDPLHDFDWKRNQFGTPSGHVGTGPSFDHTFGKGKGGFYMYEEASSPRKEKDKCRLFSPVFPPQYSDGCFLFWYHMYGATTGGLLVYVKPESHMFDELAPTWQMSGDQGNQWRRGNISVPALQENFQIVIEGVRGSSYVGDSAIDDVSISPTDCDAIYANNATEAMEDIVADSCRGRCREEEAPGFCGCNEGCFLDDTCCPDYPILCTPGNFTVDVDHPEEFVAPENVLPSTALVTEQPATVFSTTLTRTSENLHSEQYSPTAKLTIPNTTTVPSTSIVSNTTSSTSVVINEGTSTQVIPMSAMISVTPITEASTTRQTAKSPTTKMIPASASTTVSTVDSSTKAHTVTSMPVTIPKKSTTKQRLTSRTTEKTLLPTTELKTSKSPIITSASIVSSTFTTTRPSPSTIAIISSSTTAMPFTSTTTRPSTSTTVMLSTSTTTMPSTTTTTMPSRSTMTTTPIITSITFPLMFLTTLRPSAVPATLSTEQPSTLPETTSEKTAPSTPSRTVSVSTSTASSFTFSIPSTERSTSSTTKTSTTSIASTTASQTTYSTESAPATSLTGRNLRNGSSPPTNGPAITITSTRRYNLRPRTRTYSLRIPSTRRDQTTSLRITNPVTSTEVSTTYRAPRPSINTWTGVNYLTTSRSTAGEPDTKTQTILPKHVEASGGHTARSASQAELEKSPTVVAVSVSIVLLACVAGGLAYLLHKRRQRQQSKLSDDSEMRFLSENEIIEYSDASALDRILEK